jgi:hypothetical protein
MLCGSCEPACRNPSAKEVTQVTRRVIVVPRWALVRKGGRDSGETLIGARVVGGGGIDAGGSLATVVGSCTGGRFGSTVGVAADVWMAGVLAVAAATASVC